MMKINFNLVIIVLCSFLLNSCGTQECISDNPILQNNSAESAEYKKELATLLENTEQSQLSYFLLSYNHQDNSRFMMVKVQGPEICAKMKVEFEDFQKGAEAIIEKKGDSFVGAQLQNLQYEVRKDSLDTKFIFISLTSVND